MTSNEALKIYFQVILPAGAIICSAIFVWMKIGRKKDASEITPEKEQTEN